MLTFGKAQRSGSRNSSTLALDLLAEVAQMEASSRDVDQSSSEGSDAGLSHGAQHRRRPSIKRKTVESYWKRSDCLPDIHELDTGSKANSNTETYHHPQSNEVSSRDAEAMSERGLKRKAPDRISWTGELQEKFLDAVNILGIQKAVPKEILTRMGVAELTREQVASHLQKYRQSLRRLVSNSTGQQVVEEHSADQPFQKHLRPGTIAVGVPVDTSSLLFTKRYGCQINRVQNARAVARLMRMCQANGRDSSQFPMLHNMQPLDEAAIKRIKLGQEEVETSMKAEFTYPAVPPVYVPPTIHSELDIAPLDTAPGRLSRHPHSSDNLSGQKQAV